MALVNHHCVSIAFLTMCSQLIFCLVEDTHVELFLKRRHESKLLCCALESTCLGRLSTIKVKLELDLELSHDRTYALYCYFIT